MGKEHPRRYSDRIEVTGKDGGPVTVAVNDDASMIRTTRWVADLLLRANDAPAEPQNGAAIDALAALPNSWRPTTALPPSNTKVRPSPACAQNAEAMPS